MNRAVKRFVKPAAIWAAMACLDSALREQHLVSLRSRLRQIIPDIRNQYTLPVEDENYRLFWEPSVRALHAFQVKATLEALESIGRANLVVADIGDSSGNHGIYLKALAGDKIGRYVSINLDPVAVEKVRKNGGEAILCRAEEIDLDTLRPDVFVSFETVEHLMNPIGFVHGLATKGTADHLLITVPYARHSRFGSLQLRCDEAAIPPTLNAEILHMFELDPEDWSRLFLFSGFRTKQLKLYRQYPRWGFWRIMQPAWARFDYEGFAFFFLQRDLGVANRYSDW